MPEEERTQRQPVRKLTVGLFFSAVIHQLTYSCAKMDNSVWSFLQVPEAAVCKVKESSWLKKLWTSTAACSERAVRWMLNSVRLTASKQALPPAWSGSFLALFLKGYLPLPFKRPVGVLRFMERCWGLFFTVSEQGIRRGKWPGAAVNNC